MNKYRGHGIVPECVALAVPTARGKSGVVLPVAVEIGIFRCVDALRSALLSPSVGKYSTVDVPLLPLCLLMDFQDVVADGLAGSTSQARWR